MAAITGGSSGIGRAAANSSPVRAPRSVCDVKAEAGAAVADEITAAGGNAVTATDVGDEDAMKAFIDGVVERFGGLDVMYNNAGGATPLDGKVTEVPASEFWRTMKVDLFGTFLGCRFAIPHMVARGGGSIINTTSIRALTGTAVLCLCRQGRGQCAHQRCRCSGTRTFA